MITTKAVSGCVFTVAAIMPIWPAAPTSVIWRVSERVIARLSRDDARDLLIDDDREDVAELRGEADVLRLRLEQLAEAFADGALSSAQLRAGTERLRARRKGDLETRMVHVDKAPLLADLVTAHDVRKAWRASALTVNAP